MIIKPDMNLDELAECMGGCVSEDEASTMRDMLVESCYNVTEDVPESEWNKMLKDIYS